MVIAVEHLEVHMDPEAVGVVSLAEGVEELVGGHVSAEEGL